ncbi:hypothetical protein ES703_64088 [subsurface metagenome]
MVLSPSSKRKALSFYGGAFCFGEDKMTTATEMRKRYSAELEGDWFVFAKIAGYFVNKVHIDDREDFLHDLLVEMVKVKAKYEVKEKPLTEAGLMRVARYELVSYWGKRRYRLFGLNCSHCTSEQRQECQVRLPSECPKGKARRLLSLDKPGGNGDGHKPFTLHDQIGNRRVIDLDARLDARNILKGLPKSIVKIGYKVYAGIPLETKEEEYLKHWQKVHPLPIVSMIYHPKNITPKALRKIWLGERILELLRKNPQGLIRADLSPRLQVPVRELQWPLNRLVKGQQIIAVSRENIRGRPPTLLFFIAGAEIPEEKNIRAELDERIRQAYFIEGWSIKRINRELHHDKRIIRRAIRAAGTV